MTTKNGIILLFVMLVSVSYAFAQPVANSIVVGGSGRASFSASGGFGKVDATFSPSVGLQVGKLAFGTKMDLGVASSWGQESYRVMGGLWSRYYFSDKKVLVPFAEVGISQGFIRASGSPFYGASSATGTLGYAWFPAKNVALTAGLSFQYNRIYSSTGTVSHLVDPQINRTGLALNVGVTGFIPRRKK